MAARARMVRRGSKRVTGDNDSHVGGCFVQRVDPYSSQNRYF